MSVLPACVVKHLDVVEDVGLGLFAIYVDPALDALAFQELEEAFGDRVVVAVTASAHAADKAVLFQEILPFVPSELRALVRVGKGKSSRRRLAPPHRIDLHNPSTEKVALSTEMFSVRCAAPSDPGAVPPGAGSTDGSQHRTKSGRSRLEILHH